jgi:hypothetical protein
MRVLHGLGHILVQYLYDGPDLDSIGLDSKDGNWVGDDPKSSKTRKCKRKYNRNCKW